MEGQYDAIDNRQTLHARLQTLVQIVQGVVAKEHATPAFAQIKDHAVVCETVTGRRTESVITPVVHKASDDIPK